MTSCCSTKTDNHEHEKHRFDYILWGSVSVIATALALHFAGLNLPYVHHFASTVLEFLSTMWWGIVLGILIVGLMNKVPREYFQVAMGRGNSAGGIFRAVFAGLLLDMCNHGILMVGAKLYERGVSLPQVMAFLIASPWNSISLTIILITLIGLKWTLAFIFLSAVVAMISGFIFMALIKAGILPDNPNKPEIAADFSVIADCKARLKTFKPSGRFFVELVTGGMHEARMLLRWLLLGVVIAAAVRTFVPHETFAEWFGPTLFGLGMTLLATTVLEVCSEGSAPVAADIMARAAAPGNAFAFLMAGVATDYTEILVMREATKSWKIAFFLPLVTVPQVVLLGWILNQF
ncbi:MAG: ATPase [Alphaproteobacteria bacterium PRO2]|nr:ATPase [Alphaproteobacteria bacterium PRO2]